MVIRKQLYYRLVYSVSIDDYFTNHTLIYYYMYSFKKYIYILLIFTLVQPIFPYITYIYADAETPLAAAVRLPSSSCRQMIMELVNGGCHLDYRTRTGRTPLHLAARRANIIAVKVYSYSSAPSPNLP